MDLVCLIPIPYSQFLCYTATQGKQQWTSISTSVKGGGWTFISLASLAPTCYHFPKDLQATLFPFKTPAKAPFVDLPYVFG
jgi:hypothetical protein